MMGRIKTIHALEPMREGEYGSSYQVGSKLNGHEITAIERHDEYLGDRFEIWFHAMAGDLRVATMSGRAVSEIYYFTECE